MGPVASSAQGHNKAKASSSGRGWMRVGFLRRTVPFVGRKRASAGRSPSIKARRPNNDERQREDGMEAGEQGADMRADLAPALKAARVRYAVLLSLSLMYFIAYIDRTNI